VPSKQRVAGSNPAGRATTEPQLKAYIGRQTGTSHYALPATVPVSCPIASARTVPSLPPRDCSARPRWPAAARHYRADRLWLRAPSVQEA